MRRGIYSNGMNNNNTRRDTRIQSDPYVQAGVRNIHRDTRGNVIGGITAEGQRLTGGGFRVPPAGSNIPQAAGLPPIKSRIGVSATPRLDAGVQTPRIDSNRPGSPGETFAQTEARKRQESSLSGAFGTRAQTLAKNRRKLPAMAANTFNPTARAAAKLKLPGEEKPGWRNPMSLASR